MKKINKSLEREMGDDMSKTLLLQDKLEAKKERIAELGGTEVFENNILAASWIDDIATPQKEFEPRKMFFINESILIEENIRLHFDSRNEKKFFGMGQEFICIKGNSSLHGSSID